MERRYHGIRAAVASAKAWERWGNGHTQIGYDRGEDKVLWEDNCGNTHVVWSEGIINIGDYAGNSATINQVKNDIEEALKQ